MSIATKIDAIIQARNTIRTKMVSANQALSSDKLGVLAQKLSVLDTSDATATSDDILSGKSAYVDGRKVSGTLAFATQAEIEAAINAVRA